MHSHGISRSFPDKIKFCNNIAKHVYLLLTSYDRGTKDI